jgi:hypothetical protein
VNLLLHICCAPCSVACVEQLRGEGVEPVGFWYNPNIHPYTEYRARKNTLIDYAGSIGLKLELEDEYGLREFVKNVTPDFDQRCLYCYQVRMEETARFAAQHGFDTFTSTLFVSPYQNHDLLRQAAEEAAQRHGVRFRYWDFSVHFREGQAKARELGLYMQKYCGCIFSEEERYRKKKK